MRKLVAYLFLALICVAAASPAEAQICASVPTNSLQNGKVADATYVMGNFQQILSCTNTNAAKNGANNDITSLGALGAASIGVNQGGTGASSGQAAMKNLSGTYVLCAGMAGYSSLGPVEVTVATC